MFASPTRTVMVPLSWVICVSEWAPLGEETWTPDISKRYHWFSFPVRCRFGSANTGPRPLTLEKSISKVAST